MNGVHDMGGLQNFGPILREDAEPYFHHAWEERVFGLFFGLFAGGHYNLDRFRHAIEHMTPQAYLETSYYEHWLHAMESMLVADGTLEADDIVARMRQLREAT